MADEMTLFNAAAKLVWFDTDFIDFYYEKNTPPDKRRFRLNGRIWNEETIAEAKTYYLDSEHPTGNLYTILSNILKLEPYTVGNTFSSNLSTILKKHKNILEKISDYEINNKYKNSENVETQKRAVTTPGEGQRQAQTIQNVIELLWSYSDKIKNLGIPKAFYYFLYNPNLDELLMIKSYGFHGISQREGDKTINRLKYLQKLKNDK